jgi:trigger factor
MNTGMAMQITETSSEGLSREYTVVISSVEIETKLTVRLTEIGQAVSVPGFRPGKVPMTLLKQRYSESVRGEILEQTIQESTQSAMTERDLRPAMQPKIEIVTFEEGKDLEYKLGVELLPDIEPMDFSKLSLERLVADVSDEEIDNSLQRLADSRKTFVAVEDGRAAESGDQVLINFLGRVDGEAFEGGTAEDFELELGSNTFIPGFEDQLIGAKPDAKPNVTVTFPEEYPAENLKGKEAVFEVEIKEVRAVQQSAIDDEMAKGMGMDDIEALRGAIREQMQSEYSQVSRARLKRVLLDALSDNHDFEVPPGMADQEFDAIWTQLMEAKEKDQLDEDDKGKGDDELRDHYRPIAERRVRLGLLLSEVGRVNNLAVNQDDLNRAMTEQARQFPGQEASVFEYYQKNPEAMQELQAPIFEEKVVDFIVEMADVADKTVSIEELMADPDAEAAQAAETKETKPKAAKKKGKSAANKESDKGEKS